MHCIFMTTHGYKYLSIDYDHIYMLYSKQLIDKLYKTFS